MILHIADDCKEYLEKTKIEELLNKYCKFMPVPVVFGKKQKIDSSYTPSVCNYYDKSNAETPCSLNVDSINDVVVKKVNLNTIYNNMGSSEDFVVIKSNNGMFGNSPIVNSKSSR